MPVKYTERRSIPIESLARTILWKLFYYEGRTEYILSKEELDDEVYRALEISWHKDPSRDRIIVRVSSPTMKPRVTDAEYEIMQEPEALPSPQRLLQSPDANRSE